MPENTSYKRKPDLLSALSLKCPYCQKQRLLKKSSYFVFHKACKDCEYLFEREAGYWTGASWMLNFPITSSLAFLLVVYLMLESKLNEELIAAIVSGFIFAFGALIFPFCQALYLWLDHKIKPLTNDDYEEYLRYRKRNQEK